MPRQSSVDDVLPLSPTQQGMLFHSLFDEGAPDVYTGQMVIAIEGMLDAGRLRRAARALLERHANLRAEFRALGSGTFVQVIRHRVRLPWRDVDLSGLPSGDREAEFDRLAAEDRTERFDIGRQPLLRCTLVRLDEQEHRLIIASHHLLWDGWSAPILVRDLLALYTSDGEAPPFGKPRPYRDYLAWLSEKDDAAAGEAWRETLAGLDEPTLLAPGAGEGPRDVPQRITRVLPERTTSALTELARGSGITLSTVLQGLWAVLLGKLTGRGDVVFGSVVSGRPPELADVETMVGLFVNTVPVRIRLRAGEPLIDLLVRMRTEQSALLDHQHLGLADIQRVAGLGTLFDTLIVFESYPIDREAIAGALDADGATLSGISVHDATHYPLTITAMPGSALELTFGYQQDVLTGTEVAGIADRLERLVDALLVEPRRSVGRLDVLDERERREALARYDDTTAEIGTHAVRDLFEAQVARTPLAPAVRSGDAELCYAELDRLANRLADTLIARDGGPERVVGVALPRSLELVMAMLAVLKAGAAYLPIDTGYPRERIQLMLDDAAPELVICDAAFADDAGLDPRRVVLPEDGHDDGGGMIEAPRPELCADNPAYVIFTSGSTGRPKAVVGTQLALANRLAWGRRELTADRDGQTTGIRVAKSPLSFIDGSTELLGGLVAGETVIVADDATAADPHALAELVRRESVALVTVVPSLLAALADAVPADAFDSVRTWVTSGEPVSAALAADTARHWPHARLVNLYGCSEAAGDSLAHDVDGGGKAEPVPIGLPIANTAAYLLDQFLAPVPPGVPGELYLAGAGLARGYLHQPGRTAERFVANPFGPPGTRLYRTGDLARRRGDGSVEFLGRADDQVKIRGFRVEPAELESAAAALPGVAEAAAAAREVWPGERRLVAYPVAERGGTLDPLAIRRELAAVVPPHLVPAAVVPVPELPRTPSGKLDRRALPSPDFGGLSTAEAPRTGTEEVLCGLFAEVLGLDEVGIADSFFELGGDSVVSVRLVSRARGEGLVITPRDVFRCQTVAALAGVVTYAGEPAEQPTEDSGEAERRPLVSLSAAQLDRVAEWAGSVSAPGWDAGTGADGRASR